MSDAAAVLETCMICFVKRKRNHKRVRWQLPLAPARSPKWLKPLRSRRKPVPACDTCASRSRSCRSRAQQQRRSSRLRLLNPQRTGSDFLAARERGDEEGRTPASGAGAHPPDEKSLRQNSFVKWTRSQTSPNHKSDLPTVVVVVARQDSRDERWNAAGI